MHLVGDLKHLNGQTYEQSVCSVGIMGTRYIRSSTPTTNFTLVTGASDSFTIEAIRSELTIGNELSIYLRQKSGNELSWVSFEQGSPTKVKVNACDIATGSYTLTLESYDNNSAVKTVLKTDTVAIKVTDPTYVRDSSIETSIDVEIDSSKIVAIKAIRSVATLCNTLNI